MLPAPRLLEPRSWPTPYVTAGVVILLDVATKALLNTPPGAYHGRSNWVVPLVLAGAGALLLLGRGLGVPCGLLAGGMIANAVDLIDGTGHNPLLIFPTESSVIAFNLADVMIAFGTLWLTGRAVRRARARRGRSAA